MELSRPKLDSKILFLAVAFIILFYPAYFALLSYSPTIAGGFAIGVAFALSSCRGSSRSSQVLRWGSVPAFGAAILARSDLWLEEIITNFKRLLDFSNHLPASELLAVSDSWPTVVFLGASFVGYYLTVEGWPTQSKGKIRGATAISAGTQVVVVISVAMPSVLTISVGMVLAGVVATMLTGRLGLPSLAFFAMAPFYALSNPAVAGSVFMTSSFCCLLLATVYPVKDRFAPVVYGVTYTMILAPLCYLHSEGTVLQLAAVLVFAAMGWLFQWRSPVTHTVALEFCALAVGLWFLLLSFPQSPVLTVAGVVLIGGPLLTSLARDLHRPLRLYYRLVFFWFLYALLLPLLPANFGFLTPLWVGFLGLSVWVLWDKKSSIFSFIRDPIGSVPLFRRESW